MKLNRLRSLPRPLYYLYAGSMITRMGAFVFPYLTIYLSEARGYGFETVRNHPVGGQHRFVVRQFCRRIPDRPLESQTDTDSGVVVERIRFCGAGVSVRHGGAVCAVSVRRISRFRNVHAGGQYRDRRLD